MSQTQPRIGGLQIAIIVLTLITALVHLFIGFSFSEVILILNGLGYLGLLGLLYLPIAAAAPYRNYVRWILIAFAAVTIVAYFIVEPNRGTLGYVTKLVEVVLIILLFMEGRQAQP
jgi:hypothetical protein